MNQERRANVFNVAATKGEDVVLTLTYDAPEDVDAYTFAIEVYNADETIACTGSCTINSATNSVVAVVSSAQTNALAHGTYTYAVRATTLIGGLKSVECRGKFIIESKVL